MTFHWSYEYLDKTVMTPKGLGVLRQLMPGEARVQLDKEPDKLTFFPIDLIRPSTRSSKVERATDNRVTVVRVHPGGPKGKKGGKKRRKADMEGQEDLWDWSSENFPV